MDRVVQRKSRIDVKRYMLIAEAVMQGSELSDLSITSSAGIVRFIEDDVTKVPPMPIAVFDAEGRAQIDSLPFGSCIGLQVVTTKTICLLSPTNFVHYANLCSDEITTVHVLVVDAGGIPFILTEQVVSESSTEGFSVKVNRTDTLTGELIGKVDDENSVLVSAVRNVGSEAPKNLDYVGEVKRVRLLDPNLSTEMVF